MMLFRALFLTPSLVAADLPVHCLRHQIVGNWEFTMGPSSDQRSSCGHERPDNPKNQPALHTLNLYDGTYGFGTDESAKTVKKITLSLPNQASTDTDSSGTFTMIYDEGFEVVVDGKSFFAFSRYDLDTAGRNTTHCEETLTGWYHDINGGSYGCYYGKKVKPGLNSQTVMLNSVSAADLSSDSSDRDRSKTESSLLIDSDSLDSRASADSTTSSDLFPDNSLSEFKPIRPAQRFVTPTFLSQQKSTNSDLDSPDLFGRLSDPETPTSEMNLASNLFPGEKNSGLSLLSASGSDNRYSTTADRYSTSSLSSIGEISAEPLTEDFHINVVERLNSRRSIYGSKPSLLQTSGSSDSNKLKNLDEIQNQNHWTAKAYENFFNKTREELNRMAGIKRTVALSEAARDIEFEDFSKINGRDAYSSSLSSSFLQLEEDFPDHLDWEEKGVLDKVVNQGDCGSCFTVATTRMLSARHRIATQNPDAEPFSISFPLHCSEYNQGCNGGYAFLQSKWSQDVGLIPAKCFPYSGSASCSDQISEECINSATQQYKATNHRYVGGFYGGSDEKDILTELAKKGPLVVSFEPKDDFMYYNSGIYKSSQELIHQEWERVDHAVLLVGYGEQGGRKYWKLQNSWGPEWGEGGFFRIARGENDSGIESIAVAADVDESDGRGVKEFLKNRITV